MVFSLFFAENLHTNTSQLGDKALMSPKGILNVDLSYLSKCTKFFYKNVENKNPFYIVG